MGPYRFHTGAIEKTVIYSFFTGTEGALIWVDISPFFRESRTLIAWSTIFQSMSFLWFSEKSSRTKIQNSSRSKSIGRESKSDEELEMWSFPSREFDKISWKKIQNRTTPCGRESHIEQWEPRRHSHNRASRSVYSGWIYLEESSTPSDRSGNLVVY